MGTNSPDVFREELEQIYARQHPNFQIVDYERVDCAYGLTQIFYNVYLRPKTHLTHFLLLPATASMDLLIRKTQGKRKCFVHTGNRAYLGSSVNEAINRANEIGEQMMKKKEYKIARSFFDIGYNLCKENDDSRLSTFTEKAGKAQREMKKLEKEREARDQERREQERREQEKREQEKREQEKREQEERERKARTRERRQLQASEREAREQEKREQEAREEQRELELIEEWKAFRVQMNQEADERVAKSSFEQGQQLWSQAFCLEDAGNCTEAKTTFEICVNLLSKAAKLVPGNEQYSNWHKAMQLKIEGNTSFNSGVSLEEREVSGYSHFNDGYTLQERGTQFLQNKNYKEALAMYQDASQKYKQGLERSNDSRFEACVTIVEDCIARVEKVLTNEDLKGTLSYVEICGSEQIASTQQDQEQLESLQAYSFDFVRSIEL